MYINIKEIKNKNQLILKAINTFASKYMFTIKNIKLSYIAALIASCVCLMAGLVLFFTVENKVTVGVATVALFLAVYAISYYLFTFYVDRRIKLIYKLIYNTKAGKREETYYKYLLPKKTLNEVGEEVEKWAANYAEVLEQNLKAEQYRREFLQNLSHELKTPTFAIQGFIDILIEENEDHPVQLLYLKKAKRNVSRMVNLLADVDEINKLETGSQKPIYQNFIIQDLIKEVFDDSLTLLQEKQIIANIKKGCEKPISVFADRNKIAQVLTNLVQNAIKYGKQKGSIIAGIYTIDGNKILTEITDDGMGILPEHTSRVFERFYRTDAGRQRNHKGTGLGLAICKHIIEAHQQSIHIRSSIDVGTTVGFTLQKGGL